VIKVGLRLARVRAITPGEIKVGIAPEQTGSPVTALIGDR